MGDHVKFLFPSFTNIHWFTFSLWRSFSMSERKELLDANGFSKSNTKEMVALKYTKSTKPNYIGKDYTQKEDVDFKKPLAP